MLKDYLSHDLVYEKRDDWSEGEYDFARDWGWFINNSNLKDNLSMLELGCGSSPYSANFSQFSRKYVGIDISANAINKANKRHKNSSNIEFRCLNFITDWQNEKNFDLVVDSFFLHCIIGEDRKKAIEKIANSLITGGEFWLNTMCNPPRGKDLLNSYNPDSKCMEIERDSKKIAVRQFDSPQELDKLLEDQGLKLVKAKVLSDEFQDNYLAVFQK